MHSFVLLYSMEVVNSVLGSTAKCLDILIEVIIATG